MLITDPFFIPGLALFLILWLGGIALRDSIIEFFGGLWGMMLGVSLFINSAVIPVDLVLLTPVLGLILIGCGILSFLGGIFGSD